MDEAAARAALLALDGMPEGASDRLARFDALFTGWAGRHNLVARSTLPTRWARHYLDSAQLIPLLRDTDSLILDFGSGGGFPGVFLAVLLADRPIRVDLVESVGKKCAFLREVKAAFGLDRLYIHQQRIEALAPIGGVDVITARALTGLSALLDYAAPHVSRETRCLFHKGESWQEELTSAATHWTYTVTDHPSMTHPAARILELRELARVG